jgi:hypothetical protein
MIELRSITLLNRTFNGLKINETSKISYKRLLSHLPVREAPRVDLVYRNWCYFKIFEDTHGTLF